MSESRILVLDGDMARAERLATLLEFMDFTPRLVADAADLDLSRAKASDWVALVVGDVGDADAWLAFVDWLSRQPLHPPLMVLPGHDERAKWRALVHPDSVWPLDLPIRRAQLQEALRRASLKRIDAEERQEKQSIGPTGSSDAVTRLNRMIDQVAGFDTTVLVLGESGTGKEVVARTIHERSRRAGRRFGAITCGAIPPDLLEGELFGHEKGAFTGALTQRKGRFEMAEGGTLLLDEVGDMPMAMQVKLLRVLQERTFERVGGTQVYSCNVRVVAATHRNLEEQIAKGGFREDLFYRLNVFPIEMPALRERSEDLPELISAITRQLADSGRGQVSLTGESVSVLKQYHWPGNVRELHNLLERLAVLHPNGQVRAADLPARYRAGVELPAEPVQPMPAQERVAATVAPSQASPATLAVQAPAVPIADAAALNPRATLPPEGLDLKSHMAELELELIQAALQQANGVVAHAAPLLGLRRTTLVEKLRKYGIDRDSES